MTLRPGRRRGGRGDRARRPAARHHRAHAARRTTCAGSSTTRCAGARRTSPGSTPRCRGSSRRSGRSRAAACSCRSWTAPGGSSRGRPRSAGACCRSTSASCATASRGSGTTGSAPTRSGSTPRRWASSARARRPAGPSSSASDLAAVERTVDRARVLIAVCALLAGLLAAALATWLTRRALRPLTRLSAGAREIGRAGDTSRRLPEPPMTDEVGELAHTLNAMLASLERAQEAEHRFVGDASHELRTPLTALRGNAAYLAKHGPDETVIQDIADGAERLSRAARRPARAGPRGRGRAAAGRARAPRGPRPGRARSSRTCGPAASATRSSAPSTTSSATPTSTAPARSP